MVAKTNLTAVTDQVAEIDNRVVVLETEIHIQFRTCTIVLSVLKLGQLGLLLQLFFY